MVSVVGDLKPQDDYTHPPGPEPNYNESAYYNFFDNALRLGGFMRIGNRVNEGYAEVTLCLYLPDGSVLFNFKRPEISSNEAFAAGGMSFQVLEPFRRHRTSYRGHAVYLREPMALMDPRQAFRQHPWREVELELEHEAIGPVYGTTRSEGQEVDPERSFARAHFEQHMQVRGSLRVDGESYHLDALGLRDHSWGPRYWQAIPWYRWLTCSFSPSFGIMVNVTGRPDGSTASYAVVVRGTEHLEQTRQVQLEADIDPATRRHRSLRAVLELEGERLTIEGRVVGYAPLRNRRAGHVTHIGEGMTEYRCGGLVGLGISEFLDQVR
jgi:hypothetical protein